MALGSTAALMVGAGAYSATSSMQGGKLQASAIKNKASYDATIYDQQAEMVLNQKKLQDYQYNQNAAKARGTIISRTAGKGLGLGGSPLAILADTESNMLFDKAIADYNLDINKNLATSTAEMTRQTGATNARLAAYTGNANAFSTILNTGASLGQLNLKYGNGGKV